VPIALAHVCFVSKSGSGADLLPCRSVTRSGPRSELEIGLVRASLLAHGSRGDSRQPDRPLMSRGRQQVPARSVRTGRKRPGSGRIGRTSTVCAYTGLAPESCGQDQHRGSNRKNGCAAVCEPASVTRLCGAESAACAAGPHSPWSPPFAPPTPRLGGHRHRAQNGGDLSNTYPIAAISRKLFRYRLSIFIPWRAEMVEFLPC
jgi:hypothetical protein